MAAPLTDDPELRAAVARLHAAGRGRNEIAAELGLGRGTVSKIAQALSLRFDRAADVATANAVRAADLAARRLDMAEDLQDAAERFRDQLFRPHTYFDWGGKDHDFSTHDAPEPIPADKRALMSAIATAVDRSMKLAPADGSGNADDVRSMLGRLGDVLFDAFGDQPEDGGPADGG